MESVIVHRDDLLKHLTANRTAHKDIVDEAMDGYQAECERLLEEHLAAVRAGKVRRILVDIPVPVDQTKAYDRVIRMVQMSIPDEIELSSNEFACYVMDDWSWKGQFTMSNAAYSQTAASML